MDSISAAIGYTWLLKERDGADVIAARSGVINDQTAWALDYLGLDMPYLLSDASPRFDVVARSIDTATPDQPLRDAWAIASRTGGIAPIVYSDGTPFGMVSGNSLFNIINQMAGPNPKTINTTINDVLDLPCEQAADTSIEKFNKSTRIRDLLKKALREEDNEFWVVDDQGKYFGIVRQRDLLNPPRIKLILVDHNEEQQSIASLEEAELIEILDHHRLGNPPTNNPIRFTVEPVGSTSTLVTERIVEAGLAPPPEIAGLLMAGIISDTLNLISPTTTDRDHEALKRLSRWAFAPNSKFKNENIESYAEKILSAGSGLGSRPAKEIINGDIKIYEAGNYTFSISQVEVTDLYELNEHLDSLTKALKEFRESKGLDFSVMMVTDVVRGSSRLILEQPPAILEDLPYKRNSDGTLNADDLVSRKKQLVPAILSLWEG
jgi:manganese-dependent inorganic pyrophosphatase